VGGGHRRPDHRRAEDHRGRSELSVQGVQRAHLVDTESHRAHDAPATGHDAEGDGRGTGEDHPEGHLELGDKPAEQEHQGDESSC